MLFGTAPQDFQYDIYVRKTSTGEIMWDPYGGHNTGSSGKISHFISTSSWIFLELACWRLYYNSH